MPSDDPSGLRARAGWILLIILLAAFAAFAVLLRGWIAASDAAALRHEMASLMNQADRLAEDLELELSYMEERIASGEAGVQAGPAARWPDLVEAAYLLPADLSAQSLYRMEGGKQEVPDADDLLFAALEELAEGEVFPPFGQAFRLPSLLSRQGTWRIRSIEGGWILIRLDEGVLADRVLPELGERYFGEDSGFGHFALRARDPNSGASLSLGGSPGWQPPPGFWERHEFSRPLISSRSRGRVSGLYAAARDPGSMPPAKSSPGPAMPPAEGHGPSFPIDVFRFSDPDRLGSWAMEANYRSGSMESVLRARNLRNGALAFSFLAALYSLVAGLVFSARRSGMLAARERAFVASVSHELKTPIAVIISAADNLATGIIPAERALEYGRTIGKEGKRLRDAVESILLASGIQSSPAGRGAETFLLEEALRAALTAQETAAAARSASFNLAVSTRPLVKASRALVESAIASLLSNAVKYGPEGGTIEISLASARRRGRRLAEIQVADAGPGISARERSRLFTAFWRGSAASRSSHAGTGLGLFLARRIARMNGGDLSWRPRPGGGSLFTLSLREELEA